MYRTRNYSENVPRDPLKVPTYLPPSNPRSCDIARGVPYVPRDKARGASIVPRDSEIASLVVCCVEGQFKKWRLLKVALHSRIISRQERGWAPWNVPLKFLSCRKLRVSKRDPTNLHDNQIWVKRSVFCRARER